MRTAKDPYLLQLIILNKEFRNEAVDNNRDELR